MPIILFSSLEFFHSNNIFGLHNYSRLHSQYLIQLSALPIVPIAKQAKPLTKLRVVP